MHTIDPPRVKGHARCIDVLVDPQAREPRDLAQTVEGARTKRLEATSLKPHGHGHCFESGDSTTTQRRHLVPPPRPARDMEADSVVMEPVTVAQASLTFGQVCLCVCVCFDLQMNV